MAISRRKLYFGYNFFKLNLKELYFVNKISYLAQFTSNTKSSYDKSNRVRAPQKEIRLYTRNIARQFFTCCISRRFERKGQKMINKRS